MGENPLQHLYSQETLSAQPSAIREIGNLIKDRLPTVTATAPA